jgi:hypothetical protein
MINIQIQPNCEDVGIHLNIDSDQSEILGAVACMMRLVGDQVLSNEDLSSQPFWLGKPIPRKMNESWSSYMKRNAHHGNLNLSMRYNVIINSILIQFNTMEFPNMINDIINILEIRDSISISIIHHVNE